MKSLVERIFLIVLIIILPGSLIPQAFAGAETLQSVEIEAEEKVIMWAVPTPFGEENSPQQVRSASATSYASSIYNGFMRRTIASDREFVPDLAASMPVVSEDGKNWTFTLKEDLKFSDGSDLNASSVVFSYRVHLTKSIDVAYSDLSRYFTNTSIYEIDNLTVQFDMIQPYAFAPNLFSHWLYSEDHFGPQYDACSAEVTLAACDWNTDLTGGNLQGGSGPFMLDKYDTFNNFIELIPNPNYYNAGDPNDFYSPRIKIDRLVIRTIEDANAAKAAFAAGETNVFDSQYKAKTLDFANLAGVTDNFVGSLRVQEMILNHLHSYFGLGNYSTTIRDIRNINSGIEYSANGNLTSARNIRKAISHMINRTFIGFEFMGLSASPAATIIPKIAIGWDERLNPRKYNFTVAQDFMEATGFNFINKTYNVSTGAMDIPFFEITILSPTDNFEREQWVAIIAKELPKIGIGIKGIISNSLSSFYPRTIDYPSPPPVYDNGGYDVFFSGNQFNLDWDPTGLYEFDSQNPECCNVYNYKNSTLEGAIADYVFELDAVKRFPLTKRVQELLYDSQPTIPIVHETNHWAWANYILGLDDLSMSLRSVEWELVDVNFDFYGGPRISTQTTIICTITCPVGYFADNCDCVKSSTLPPASDTRAVNLNIPKMYIVLSTFVFMMVINLRVSRKRNFFHQ